MNNIKDVREFEKLIAQKNPVIVLNFLALDVQSQDAQDRLSVGEQAKVFTLHVVRSDMDAMLWEYMQNSFTFWDVKHESPQVLIFHNGICVAHANHDAVTAEWVMGELADLELQPN